MHSTSCEIPLHVYRRLRLLYLIERFHDGCYGATRLQKVAFFSEREQPTKVFTFRKAPRGPYSEELRETLEQLLSMGLVSVQPTPEGNGYRAVHSAEQTCEHAEWLRAISPEARDATDRAVRDYGYLRHAEVIEAGHGVPGFAEAAPFDVLLEANAGEFVAVPLSRDECDDLVLSLSPRFIATATGIAAAAADFDFERVPAG